MAHPDTVLRDEQPGDEAAIYQLTQRAFAPMAFAAGDEQDLISALRAAGALSLSLAAVRDDQIVGHIAFSPASAADDLLGWYALGPVSVDPALQGQGIGGRLIEAGLARLTALQAAGCILTGNPVYYRRFGFVVRPDLAPPGEPAKYFMVRPLGDPSPNKIVAFHPLFHAGPAEASDQA
jgi:putative acetyltransferase